MMHWHQHAELNLSHRHLDGDRLHSHRPDGEYFDLYQAHPASRDQRRRQLLDGIGFLIVSAVGIYLIAQLLATQAICPSRADAAEPTPTPTPYFLGPIPSPGGSAKPIVHGPGVRATPRPTPVAVGLPLPTGGLVPALTPPPTDTE